MDHQREGAHEGEVPDLVAERDVVDEDEQAAKAAAVGDDHDGEQEGDVGQGQQLGVARRQGGQGGVGGHGGQTRRRTLRFRGGGFSPERPPDLHHIATNPPCFVGRAGRAAKTLETTARGRPRPR